MVPAGIVRNNDDLPSLSFSPNYSREEGLESFTIEFFSSLCDQHGLAESNRPEECNIFADRRLQNHWISVLGRHPDGAP